MLHKGPLEANVNVFNGDVANNAGYLYTTNARISSRFANERLTKATLAMAEFQGKRVIDIGCGDGTYTRELFDCAHPASITGVDPADKAIERAQQQISVRNVDFDVQSAYELPYADGSFDIAYLRAVLHHMDEPQVALREALRVARKIVVIEPNGYNPVLKLLERYSRYHIEHHEKSYWPVHLDRWIAELGGTITNREFVGLVPYFCPDWFARTLKIAEPIVELVPLIRACVCGQYVFAAERTAIHGVQTPAASRLRNAG